jgi:DNA-binding Lrp family transcriptional regulator
MTHKEVDLVQKIGCSAFSIYSFLKTFPRSSNRDVQLNLNISMPTLRKSLQRLEETGIIKRNVEKNNTREVKVLPENEWMM